MAPLFARHPARRGRIGLAAGLIGLLALSACGWFGSSTGESSATATTACPSAVILHPLANTVIVAPGGSPRPTDVAYYGILSEVGAKCATSGDNVRVSLDVVIAAERGPAAKGDSADLNYFVVVTGPDQSILSKKPFAVRIPLPDNARRGGVTDHIEEAIPLAGRGAADLTVVLGFQQTPQVLEFYKTFRGR